MNRKIVFVFFIIFTTIFLIVYSISTTAAPPPPQTEGEGERERIQQAVYDAVGGGQELVLGYLVNDVQVTSVELSRDESTGIIYLEMIDPDTGEVLPAEPGLAFAVQSDGQWEIVLPSDPGWIELVNSAPQELLADDSKSTYQEMYTTSIQATQATYSGYRLPWQAGKTVYLSQSTGHDRYIPSGSAHYSFDFYIPQTMYQLRASKAGTVWRARWDVPNGNDDDMGNYLVLRDESTSPTTYQLYLHLAQNSIPKELRKTGTYVARGQFIGTADDTGQSTGHHLHFQVHTNPISYWGTSVDITFKEVDINGGRPRRESDLPYCTRPGDVCTKFRNNYVSANTAPGDSLPPIGDLFEPETGDLVNSNWVHFEGWAHDEGSGISSLRLLAYYNNEWHEVGDEITKSTFSADWDMCSYGVPDGPVSLALKIWDKAGNASTGLPGLTHIVKNYKCSQELIQCIPGANQIAIYSDLDFQGVCQVLETGEYSQLSPDLDLNIESIQVGGNVLAEVFGNKDFQDRMESIHQNDSSLDDNLVRGDQIRSLKVTPRTNPILPPQTLLYPLPGSQFPSRASLTFAWRYSGPGRVFQVNLKGPSIDTNSGWLPSTFWISDNLNLPEGIYNWKVRTSSCPDGTCPSDWSQPSSFTIIPGPPALLSTQAPFVDNLENGVGNWIPTGLWNLQENPDRSHSSNHAWYYGLPANLHYDSGVANSGTLTSKPILVPANNYMLRFWYRYDSEGQGENWDQRWLQISANGGPFKNILQLKNDVEDFWLQATLDLAEYAGNEIQIRFLFTTLDALDNISGEGWFIDDIEIIQGSPPQCSDGNNSPATAEVIGYNQPLTREMCPTGDLDYYKFDGIAGDHIVQDINAQSIHPIENLDLYLYLLDSDGRSRLVEHDDEILGNRLDPHLGYQLKRTGTYYVLAKLYAHPSFGGQDFDYEITLTKDNTPPQGSFIYPQSNDYVNSVGDVFLSVDATDSESGISYVEFLYHSNNWQASNWQLLGIDQDGTDGWELPINVNEYPEQKGAAFFANIFDWAGNKIGSGAWEVGFDRTPPITSLNSLAPAQQSTAVQLQWTGTDNVSGVDFYQLQARSGGGDWLNINPSPLGAQKMQWFVGEPGSDYGFRIRGVDIAGNLELFPETPEASTTIPAPTTLCSEPDSWDKSGSDNSAGTSTYVEIAAQPSIHNFCNPLSGDRLFDEDWVNFDVVKGQTYLVESQPLAAMSASVLELYSSDGTTLIASVQPDDLNTKTRIVWISDFSDKVFLRVRHPNGKIAGNIVSYQLIVNKFKPIYFPFIPR